MRKMIVVLAAVVAVALAVAAPTANAGACRTVKCFNKQVSRLQSEVMQLATALKCLQPVAVTRYGGYDYNGVAAATTALDFTESGDAVSTWVVGIQPGACGSPQTRNASRSALRETGPAARSASAFGPFQAIPSNVDRSHRAGP